jgi:hypothetical protein
MRLCRLVLAKVAFSSIFPKDTVRVVSKDSRCRLGKPLFEVSASEKFCVFVGSAVYF